MPMQPLTRGQAERTISQQVQAVYRNQLGHQPGKVTCQIFDAKLAIVIEDAVTSPEQLLAEEGRIDLVAQVRTDLDRAIRPHLKSVIESVLNVNVLDLMSDSTLETGRTGVIAVLETSPQLRSVAPHRRHHQSEFSAEQAGDPALLAAGQPARPEAGYLSSSESGEGQFYTEEP
jgi:uncharacterized protein YbcI